MSWKKWRVGLLVAFIIGFFTACGAAAILDVQLNAKFYLFFIGLIGKDVILYLKENKIENIEDTKPPFKT
jgi:hypothetical protein